MVIGVLSWCVCWCYILFIIYYTIIILLLYTIHYYYIILLLYIITILFSSSSVLSIPSQYSHPLLPISYSLFSSSLIHSILVDTYIYLTIFLLPLPNIHPACFEVWCFVFELVEGFELMWCVRLLLYYYIIYYTLLLFYYYYIIYYTLLFF